MGMLDWPGAVNARDLGGIPTADGRRTRRGALVRSGALDSLEPEGWAELERFGIRTVVDLRNDGEIKGDLHPRPASVETLQIPLDVSEDREFWGRWESGPQFGTSATAVLVGTLAGLEVEATMLAAGLTAEDLTGLRSRFLAGD
jgi:hypothetical protein